MKTVCALVGQASGGGRATLPGAACSRGVTVRDGPVLSVLPRACADAIEDWTRGG